MCEQERLGVDVQKLNYVVVTNDTAATSLGECLRRDDLPVVVGIFVAITRDLLTLTTDATILILKRVTVGVRVQEDPRVLVPDRDSVIITKLWTASQPKPRSYAVAPTDLDC